MYLYVYKCSSMAYATPKSECTCGNDRDVDGVWAGRVDSIGDLAVVQASLGAENSIFLREVWGVQEKDLLQEFSSQCVCTVNAFDCGHFMQRNCNIVQGVH